MRSTIPLVGYLSDRSHSPWGRRYPWIALGALPFGLTFFLTWIVPGWQSETARFWYYVVISLVFQMFYTVVNLPYTTLTAELTQDYDERTELTAFRLGSSLMGAIAALALGLVVSKLVADLRQQYLILAALCSGLSVLPLFWCVLGTYPAAVRRGCFNLDTRLQQRIAYPSFSRYTWCWLTGPLCLWWVFTCLPGWPCK
jgi:GPH family glycoside/pentoside/hexuronide:cation symporter